MRKRLWRPGLALATIAVLALLAAACNGDDEPSTPDGSPADGSTPTAGGSPSPPLSGNQFPNGGFEDGRDPWFSLKPPDFELSTDVANSGEASAYLPWREGVDSQGTSIYYLVQEITPQELPEVLSGYYRVENWKKGTLKQYLQFVVIVIGGSNAPSGFPNHQIRYLLAGIDSPPFPIGNAKFVFVSKEQPVEDEWVHFERNVADDFERLWGAVPENFEKIRVLFEVRYDDKVVGEGPVEADVYYDDLYFGPPQ
jgi:hypothetical protein